ncbi:MAG: hypothetical protein ACOCVN_00965 [bacterium]
MTIGHDVLMVSTTVINSDVVLDGSVVPDRPGLKITVGFSNLFNSPAFPNNE